MERQKLQKDIFGNMKVLLNKHNDSNIVIIYSRLLLIKLASGDHRRVYKYEYSMTRRIVAYKCTMIK